MSKVKVITYFSVDEDKIRTFLMGMQLDMNDNTDGQFIGYEVTSITEDEIINEKALFLTKIIEEQEASFELYWSASMRAIKMWQEATGEDMVWPDQAHLIVWLLEEFNGLQARYQGRGDAVSVLYSWMGDDVKVILELKKVVKKLQYQRQIQEELIDANYEYINSLHKERLDRDVLEEVK